LRAITRSRFDSLAHSNVLAVCCVCEKAAQTTDRYANRVGGAAAEWAMLMSGERPGSFRRQRENVIAAMVLSQVFDNACERD
jgi:hypothetical protein